MKKFLISHRLLEYAAIVQCSRSIFELQVILAVFRLLLGLAFLLLLAHCSDVASLPTKRKRFFAWLYIQTVAFRFSP